MVITSTNSSDYPCDSSGLAICSTDDDCTKNGYSCFNGYCVFIDDSNGGGGGDSSGGGGGLSSGALAGIIVAVIVVVVLIIALPVTLTKKGEKKVKSDEAKKI